MYAKTSHTGLRFFAHAPGAVPPPAHVPWKRRPTTCSSWTWRTQPETPASAPSWKSGAQTVCGESTCWLPTPVGSGGWRWRPSLHPSRTLTSLPVPNGCAPTASPPAGSATSATAPTRPGSAPSPPYASPDPTAPSTYLAEQDRQRRIHEARAAAARRAQERKRAEIRQKNTASQAKAQGEAATAERAARNTPQGAKRRNRAGRRPEIAQALALLTTEYGATATVGCSTGDPRYAGGTPLVDEDGVPVAVFDPILQRVRGHAFLLLAGTLLLFPSKGHQLRFETAMDRTKRKPMGGYRTDFVDSRPCACTTPQLLAKVSGIEYPAEPSDKMSTASALYQAECRACGVTYEGPWRRTSSTPVHRTGSPEQ